MINLLPPKKLLNMRIARSNTILRRYIELIIMSMAIVGAALAASYYFLYHQQQNVRTTLETNQKKVAELAPIQKEAEQLSATVNTISGLLSRNITFSDMLIKIGGTMPNGAVLTGMQFSIENTDAPFVISAEVENEERAAVLRNNLVASGLFKSVEIKSITLKEQKEAQPATTDAPSSTTGTGTEIPAAATPTPQPDRYRYQAEINTYLKDLGATR